MLKNIFNFVKLSVVIIGVAHSEEKSSWRWGLYAAYATVRQGKADFPDKRKSQASPGNRELATTALTPVEELWGKHLFKAVMNMLF